jgi:hypothetical protein
MSPIEVTRQELYDLVWETPTRHLGKRFGLSDVGLAKTCKRYKIPRPSYGYWAKKAAGGEVTRTRLPPCDDKTLEKIVFSEHEPRPEEDDGFFDSEIRALHELETQAEPIVVGDSLRSPHVLVSRTRDALAGAKPSEWSRIPGLLYPTTVEGMHLLDIACGRATLPRALRIMDAVLKGLEQRGYTLGKSENSWHHGTAATAHGCEFVFRVREPAKRQLNPKPHSWGPRYDLVLTGDLQLEIDSRAFRSTRVCRDSLRKKVEDYVRELPLKMLEAIDDNRRVEAQRAEEQRRRDEIQRLEEEAADRKARREMKLRRRRERREELFQTAEQWRRAQTLREFIEAVRTSAIEQAEGAPLPPETTRWLKWAERTAHRADPLEQMQRSVDRMKAQRRPK